MNRDSARRAGLVLVAVLIVSTVSTVSMADGAGSAAAVVAAPTFTSFSPQYGPAGTVVSIRGNGFAAVTGVLFNGTAGRDFHRLSATALTAAVPPRATTGPITLVTAGADPSTTSSFVVIAPKVSLTVGDGVPGTATTVSGSGFQPYDAVDVYLATTKVGSAPASARGEFSAAVTVPATMVAGSVQVVATGRARAYTGKAAFGVHTDWNEQGFTSEYQSSNPSENTINAGNVSTLVPRFTVPHGPSVMGAVANGRVFFSQGGSIKAVTTSGAASWTRAGGYSPAAPVVAASVVYVGGTDGSVSALNAVTGVPLWKKVIDPAAAPTPVVTEVEVVNGRVYASLTQGARTVRMAAVNAADGTVVWNKPVGDGVFAGFSIGRDRLLVTLNRTSASSLDGHMVALSAATGDPTAGTAGVENLDLSRFSYFLRNSARRELTIFSTHGAPTLMAAVDFQGGDSRWFYDATAAVGAGLATDPVVAGDLAYVAARSSDPARQGTGVLAAVGVISGQPVWTQPLAFSRKPLVANGLLYAPCGPAGDLFVFNATTGRQLLRRDYPCGDVFVTNGRVYVDAPDGFRAYGLSGEHPAVTVLNDTVTGTAPNQLGYAGTWTTSTTPGAYLNNLHASTTANSTVRVTFTGNGVRYWYSTGPDHGKLTVSIDGGPAVGLDQWSSTPTNGLTSWTSAPLATGRHTAVITVLGSKQPAATDEIVSVDRIDIGG